MPKFHRIHSKHVISVGIVQLLPIHIAMRTYCVFVPNHLKLCSHAKVRKESDFLCFSRRCVWKFLREKYPKQCKITTERNTTMFGFVFLSAFVIQVSWFYQNCYGVITLTQNSRCKLFAKDITHSPEHIYAIKNYLLVLKLFRNNTHVIPLLKCQIKSLHNVENNICRFFFIIDTPPVKRNATRNELRMHSFHFFRRAWSIYYYCANKIDLNAWLRVYFSFFD